mmetsp:Transcript_70360/g.111238  ORF Transcript_70360/g.111238 Transcript_70360/m.111238 type:complete len:550 (-) Transcript_70360:73-1722(-)
MEQCVRYDLRLHFQKATGLRAADLSLFRASKSDPFLQCQVRGRPWTRVKTKTIYKTLDPEWNETFLIEGVKLGDTLDIDVLDYDLIGDNDKLGSTSLRFEEFINGFAGERVLDDTGTAVSRVFFTIEVIPPAEVQLAETRAFVRVVDAHNLRCADTFGRSDPYVIVKIRGKERSKWLTRVIRKTIDPVWDEWGEMCDYSEGDEITFQVYDHDEGKEDGDLLGRCSIPNEMFHPNGYAGHLMLTDAGKTTGQALLNFQIEVEAPPPLPPPLDPLHMVTQAESQRIPFRIRSLETDRVHNLRGYTQIGRSKKLLHPERDLIISQLSGDVGRIHAYIKAILLPDQQTYLVRVYEYAERDREGNVLRDRQRHLTSVDGNEVDDRLGLAIQPGCIMRFGKQELWVLEASSLLTQSERGAAANRRANVNSEDDPSTMRVLEIPSVACHDALRACKDWISFVRVSLEWLNEPDEPPCVDKIEVVDERGHVGGCQYIAASFEEQQAFDIKRILGDVRLGTTVRLRLSSDPFLLAPVLTYLEELQKWLDERYESHTYD